VLLIVPSLRFQFTTIFDLARSELPEKPRSSSPSRKPTLDFISDDRLVFYFVGFLNRILKLFQLGFEARKLRSWLYFLAIGGPRGASKGAVPGERERI